jgi:hypothetical protein
MADKLADTDRLGQPFTAEIMLYFSTGQDALYQLLPWLPALEALDAEHRVVCVFRDSRTADRVRAASTLDCVTLATYGQLDEILSVSDVKLALYVNHDHLNFESLRFTSLTHIYLGHGDSDKGVSSSNQIKAYDLCFLAGQAALERTAASVMDYDAAARSVLIGQPQLDAAREVARTTTGPTALYAPTWEGSQPSVSYGSLATQGEAIMRSLAATYAVIYRPHPLSGVVDPAYAAADAAVRVLASRVDTDVTLEQSFADADVLITDVSAVVLNWLPTGSPVVVTRPTSVTAPSKLLDSLPRLAPGDDALAVVETAQPPPAELVEHYLGDVTPGAATRAFVEACGRAIAHRDTAWATRRAQGATGP